MNTHYDCKLLIDQLMDSLIPMAVPRGSFIINEVPEFIYITTDRDLLAHLVGNLVKNALQYSENDCIRISAKSFSNVILLHIKGSRCNRSAEFLENLEQLEPLAEKMGGCISLQTMEPSAGGMIILSFLKNATRVSPGKDKLFA